MTDESSSFIEQLRHVGEVEWFRYSASSDKDGNPVPPIIVWRFTEPRPTMFIDQLRRMTESTERKIDWTIDTSRRNWVLMPSRIVEVKARQHLATDAQAIHHLTQEDSEFCRNALTDLTRIVNELNHMITDRTLDI